MSETFAFLVERAEIYRQVVEKASDCCNSDCCTYATLGENGVWSIERVEAESTQ